MLLLGKMAISAYPAKLGSDLINDPIGFTDKLFHHCVRGLILDPAKQRMQSTRNNASNPSSQ